MEFRQRGKTDLICRMGGDEFCILFKGLTNRNDIEKKASRIITDIKSPIPFKKHKLNVSCSIGITTVGQNQAHMEPSEIINSADKAMYAAKQKGKSCFTYDGFPNA